MATYNKFHAFVEHRNEGVHNFSSDATCTLTVALCAAANPPVATNSVLADLTQISYTNLSSRVITIASSGQTSGLYKLILNDLTLTASGAVASFRYVVIYNDDPTSPADPLICWLDHGSTVTLASGEEYRIDFNGTNGLFTDT